MMKITKQDTSVGAFLLVAIAAVMAFLIAKANTQGWVGAKRLTIEAIDGHNIKEQAPVRMNGIQVGNVERIDMGEPEAAAGSSPDAKATYRQRILITFRVNGNYAKRLHEGLETSIVEPPVLGLTFVDIMYNGELDRDPIKDGAVLTIENGGYKEPPTLMATVEQSLRRIESIIRRTDDALAKANVTIEAIGKITAGIADGDGFVSKLIKDQQLSNDLKETIANVALSSKDMVDVTNAIHRREGALGRLLSSDELVVQTEKLLAKARESLASLDEVTKRLTGSVELVANRLDQTGGSIEGVKEVLENTKKITAELAVLTANLNAGKGTMGKFLSDDAVYVEARGLLKELRETVQDLREQAPINSFIGVVFSAF
ncbi:MAG TPA: MlaD family protein [Planctomycetota bacterium]|nr:MlaD family protein [Planctomycetota bacterium]